jgi:hypothetical protein
VFDAPINKWQSLWSIDAAATKYLGKPIECLVKRCRANFVEASHEENFCLGSSDADIINRSPH